MICPHCNRTNTIILIRVRKIRKNTIFKSVYQCSVCRHRIRIDTPIVSGNQVTTSEGTDNDIRDAH